MSERDPLNPHKKAFQGLSGMMLKAEHLSDAVLALPASSYAWLHGLSEMYGSELLILLFGSQHVIKGFLPALLSNAPAQFLYASYGISSSLMQVFMGITYLPWAMKPIIGVCSDLFPINGYNKGPYIVMTSVIGVLSLAVIGLVPQTLLPVSAVVGCFIMFNLQISTTDLLTEAKYSEVLIQKPEKGPDLLAYIWGGMTIAGVCAMSVVGFVIESYGPKFLYAVGTVPASFMIWLVFRGYLQETQQSDAEVHAHRARQLKSTEIMFLSVLMFMATLGISTVGLVTHSPSSQLVVVACAFVSVLIGFSIVLRPEIAKVSAFNLIQASAKVSISGAVFYFYTNTAEQYPEGPHFSKFFFTTTLGIVGAVGHIIGLYVYRAYFAAWSYRKCLILGNVLLCSAHAVGILIFTRTNSSYGIDDTTFILVYTFTTSMMDQWQWMPKLVLWSHVCPPGLEATMFALLAGCHNLGGSISQFFGAFLLHFLDVNPRGAVNESAQFNNLGLASLISTGLTALTIFLIPWCVPDALQTEKLMSTTDCSPTSDSLWQRWGMTRSTTGTSSSV